MIDGLIINLSIRLYLLIGLWIFLCYAFMLRAYHFFQKPIVVPPASNMDVFGASGRNKGCVSGSPACMALLYPSLCEQSPNQCRMF